MEHSHRLENLGELPKVPAAQDGQVVAVIIDVGKRGWHKASCLRVHRNENENEEQKPDCARGAGRGSIQFRLAQGPMLQGTFWT